MSVASRQTEQRPASSLRCSTEAKAAARRGRRCRVHDVIDRAGAGALRVHAPAGVVPPQPSEHLQRRRVSGDVSAGSSLKTRDRAGARRLGRYLIVLELHAGIVIGFETLRHAGQRGTLRRSLPPADYCVEFPRPLRRRASGMHSSSKDARVQHRELSDQAQEAVAGSSVSPRRLQAKGPAHRTMAVGARAPGRMACDGNADAARVGSTTQSLSVAKAFRTARGPCPKADTSVPPSVAGWNMTVMNRPVSLTNRRRRGQTSSSTWKPSEQPASPSHRGGARLLRGKVGHEPAQVVPGHSRVRALEPFVEFVDRQAADRALVPQPPYDGLSL
jgi:hypothetical protein